MATEHNQLRAAQAFIWTNSLKAPFWAIYGLLMFIMKKDLGASYFQISLLIALKPIVGLLAPYWSALVHKRPQRLRSNLIWATILSHAPFFFFPIFDSPWFIIFAGSLFLLMKRGIIPAWMEVLKRNLPKGKRENTFSYGSMISFFGGALLPFLFGSMMDKDPGCWRMLFPLTSLISIAGTFFILRLPAIQGEPSEKASFDFKKSILRPWTTTYNLLRTRSDFFRYQLGFMLGGGGLLMMQPALPAYFVDGLHLSYKELAFAIATCKGIGFVLTSRVWASFMKKIGIYQFSGLVTVFGALFPLFLFGGKFGGTPWVFAAYLIYGVMQAGSELTWHLSGPVFSKNEDSSAYSSANVIMVGLRGIFAPYIGGIICAKIGGPIIGMMAGSVLCILATIQLFLSETAVARQKAVQE